ncbi:MAG TPA: hypothetical protein VGG10_12715 [Rhizomicrobium sp.]|jgi:serralysin
MARSPAISLAPAAKIFNYGTIDGSLTFGAASTYNGLAGIITGDITGSDGNDKILMGSDPYNHHLNGGAGNDVINGGGGTGTDVIYGGLGRDTLIGGDGANIFVYKHVAESKGAHYDVTNISEGSKIDVNVPVQAVDPTIVNATINEGTSFTAQLAAILGPGALHAHDAVVVQANEGTDVGYFLVIDANGMAGYQASGDYVIEIRFGGGVTIHNFI